MTAYFHVWKIKVIVIKKFTLKINVNIKKFTLKITVSIKKFTLKITVIIKNYCYSRFSIKPKLFDRIFPD